ncbi:MAG: helix-turn-helix domain-containing protein [bacterium]|nr:helix-turn-helix domain-containing protein [bacterium]
MIKVGQWLREERTKKSLTIEDIEKSTKIKASFISIIERGEYQKLPSSTYAYGFVGNYAQFLGLPKSKILALFKREFDENKTFKVLPEGFSKDADFPIQRIRLKQASILIIVFFLILLGYILFQYRYAVLSPELEINMPKDNEVFSSKQVTVSGQTDPNATVYINNISVSLNENGIFKRNIDLFPGKTTIKIKAVNRFGKETNAQRVVEIK